MSVESILAEEVLDAFAGMLTPWSGAIVDIPLGWQLCDGSGGTPDLRDRFIAGAGSTYNPDETGGSQQHTHAFIPRSHGHHFPSGNKIIDSEPAGQVSRTSTTDPLTGTTDPKNNLPTYYALAYIMRM